MSIPKEFKPLKGYSYIVREELKALGCRWDRDTQLWWAPPENVREAEELIEEARFR